MLTNHQLLPLARSIRANRAVLFLGAGFSLDATNRHGNPLPSGKDLAVLLWNELGYPAEHGDYDGTALKVLFNSARKRLGEKKLLSLLDGHLSVKSYADWYKRIAAIYWRRIYTTNVDNLIETAFGDARSVRLSVLNGVRHGYEERDPLLGAIQYVKLNGSLSDEDVDALTFDERQIANRTSKYDPWYDHFVRDYSQYATLLVGTQLDEPLFWNAVQSRRGRAGAAIERRQRSFLIAPKISPALADSLAEFNVVPVRAKGADFFQWLVEALGTLPSRDAILVDVDPRLVAYVEASKGQKVEKGALEAFFRAFLPVELRDAPSHYKSLFYLGGTPRWDDIAGSLDARREINARVFESCQARLEAGEGGTVVISGHRGAGKSTLLMRTAWDLTATGYACLFCHGENVPPPWVVAGACERIGRTVALIVDDAEWIASKLSDYVSRLRTLEKPPLLLLAIRSNVLYRIGEAKVGHELHEIGDLTVPDIDAVVHVLRDNSGLGTMTGEKDEAIREAFQERHRQQLLVAMREVTSNDEFDRIIQREFDDLEEPEHRIVYLAACLATAASASLARDQLVALTELTPGELLAALEGALRQLLVSSDELDERFAARHQVIAEVIVDELANKEQLGIAYRRLLEVLAHDIGAEPSRGPGRRWFRLYKRLINHDVVYKRFAKDLNEARAVFDAVKKRFEKDPHFWLQYGSLELHFGELELADLYLHTAESLNPEDFLIGHAMAHLTMVRAVKAPNQTQAITLRSRGEDLLHGLINEQESAYPWHTLIAQTHYWLEKWESDSKRRAEEYKRLKELAKEAREEHPFNPDIRKIQAKVDRAYLETAL